MYFSTFNHYDEQYEHYKDEDEPEQEKQEEIINELCLICLDTSTTNNKLVKMKTVINYLLFSKYCSCNGIFHYNCLLKWIDTTTSCPICRKPIERDKNEENLVNLNNKSQMVRFINFTNNNAYKLLKCILYFYFFKIVCSVVLDIQRIVENQSDFNQEECY
jgi:hypothetical protein